MGKNYIRMELGGQERGLKFNLRALKIIKEVSGDDPFAFFIGGDLEAQIKQISAIMYAGLVSNAASKKQEPDFTYDDCVFWTEDLDLEDAKKVIAAFGEAYKSDASGEGSADTQQAANMEPAS